MTQAVPKPAPEQEPTHTDAKKTFEISRDEILLGRNVLRTQMNRLEDSVAALVDAFIDGRYAEIKEASENVRTESRTVATTASQIQYVASGLVNGCIHQLNRRPRA